jgi:uncharacterized protein (DUF58 family)
MKPHRDGSPTRTGRFDSAPSARSPTLRGARAARVERAMKARSSPRSWLESIRRPPRRLRFTREGKFFTIITFGVGVAAINTGNNLLYLVLGLMLSLIVLSGVLSELALRGLSFRRRLPKRAFAGSSLLVEIEVQNNKTWAPSYSVEVEDRIENRVTDKRCYFLKVSSGAKQTAAYRRVAPLRGRERYTGLRVATRFPFGLFEKWREVEIEDEHVVFPSLAAQADPPRPHALTRGGVTTRRDRGRGDVDGLRELRDGESAREVDWKKTAQSVHAVIVRERMSEGARVVQIEVRNGASERQRPGFAGQFEEELRRIAWRATQALEAGALLEVRVQDGGNGRSAFVRIQPGGDAVDRALRFLALLPPDATLSASDASDTTAPTKSVAASAAQRAK